MPTLTLAGNRSILAVAGEPTRKAESPAVVRGRPVEPAPGNAGEGIAPSSAFSWRLLIVAYDCAQRLFRTEKLRCFSRFTQGVCPGEAESSPSRPFPRNHPESHQI